MWNILLAFEEGAKALVGSTLVTKMITLQTEYTGTRKTQITLHVCPCISRRAILGTFMDYGPVNRIYSIKSKSGIATNDFEVLVALTQPKFNEIPNIITCPGCNIFVVVEGWHPFCWACGVAGHLSKLYPIKNPTPQMQPTMEQPTEEATRPPVNGVRQ